MGTPTPARAIAVALSGAPTPHPGVVTLAWPTSSDVRHAVAASGRACLLVVPPGEPPPDGLRRLEDWIREPVDPAELSVRLDELRRRQRARAKGLHLDDEGLLWLGARWVALSPVQRSLLAPLLEEVGQPVPLVEVQRAYTAAGGPDDRRPLQRALARLRVRLAELDAELHTLSGRAVLLQIPEPDLFT